MWFTKYHFLFYYCLVSMKDKLIYINKFSNNNSTQYNIFALDKHKKTRFTGIYIKKYIFNRINKPKFSNWNTKSANINLFKLKLFDFFFSKLLNCKKIVSKKLYIYLINFKIFDNFLFNY